MTLTFSGQVTSSFMCHLTCNVWLSKEMVLDYHNSEPSNFTNNNVENIISKNFSQEFVKLGYQNGALHMLVTLDCSFNWSHNNSQLYISLFENKFLTFLNRIFPTLLFISLMFEQNNGW